MDDLSTALGDFGGLCRASHDGSVCGWVSGLLLLLVVLAGLVVQTVRLRKQVALLSTVEGQLEPLLSVESGSISSSAERSDLLAVVHRLRCQFELRQRSAQQSEQLLHTLMDEAPMAILLLEDAGAIEYVNESARRLFFEGKNVLGDNFLALLGDAPEALREAVLDVQDRFFTVEAGSESESYHLAKRHFELHGRTHTLLMVKHLTRELRQREIDVWKKLIRVLSHELNNSLAPITSLVHSARVITSSVHSNKLERVFATIEERTKHLQDFVESYAKFARLPNPKREHVNLGDFIRHVSSIAPEVQVTSVPLATAYFDRSQLEQVLINLLKNAKEAGGRPEDISLDVHVAKDGAATFRVEDRGTGMSEQVMANATLPFYSTKERGSGLGLALCREIVEAHGGVIRLENREGGGVAVTVTLPGFERRELAATAKLTLSRL